MVPRGVPARVRVAGFQNAGRPESPTSVASLSERKIEILSGEAGHTWCTGGTGGERGGGVFTRVQVTISFVSA